MLYQLSYRGPLGHFSERRPSQRPPAGPGAVQAGGRHQAVEAHHGARLVGPAGVPQVALLQAPSVLPEQVEEERGVGPPRVGDQRLAARREEAGEQGGEGHPVALLVEQVGAHHEVVGGGVGQGRRWVGPVDQHGRHVHARLGGVGVDEGQRLPVPVGRQRLGAAERGDDRGEADAAAQLDHPAAGEVAAGELAREDPGAGPELRPVGQPLVARVVVLVDQVLRTRRGWATETGQAPTRISSRTTSKREKGSSTPKNYPCAGGNPRTPLSTWRSRP